MCFKGDRQPYLAYNSAKDVPHFCKWGLELITGGEHISLLVEMPQRKVCLWQTLIEGIINTSYYVGTDYFLIKFFKGIQLKLRMISRKFCDNLDILAHIFENTLIFCPSGYIYISEGRNQATSVQRQDIRIYDSSDLKTSSDLPYHHPSQP